ncbi:MAG TPA: hypothetical protein VIM86_17315, partial [Thermodesulfobacteriota bacterium]
AGVSLLAQVAAAADPAIAAHAAPDPPRGRFEAVADRERAFVLEAVHEGYLMHYGEPRGFAGMDGDLRLLGGDALYALGLARLAEAGDLDAIAELCDLISLCAWAHADGRPELAEAAWEAAAARVADGRGEGSRAAVEARLRASA